MAKNRIFYYDILRAIAILGIIACHMTTCYISKIDNYSQMNIIFLHFFNQLRQFAIPIFVLISGALLVNKDYSSSVFIKKKFNRILIPYIFWAIILVIFSILLINLGVHTDVLNSLSPDYVFKSILGLNKGFARGRYFWFIWMILVVYILLFILNKIIIPLKEEDRKKAINALTLLFIIFTIIAPHLPISLNSFKNPLAYYIAFTGYGILGYCLANTDFTNIAGRIRINEKTIFLLSSIIFALLYLFYVFNEIGLYGTYFNLFTIMLSSSIFLSFRYFEESYKNDKASTYSKIRNGKLGETINSLSKYSFGIYLIHPIIYLFYKYIVFGSVDLLKHSPIKWSSLFIVLVLFTSWGIIWLMSQVPYLDKVSGAG